MLINRAVLLDRIKNVTCSISESSGYITIESDTNSCVYNDFYILIGFQVVDEVCDALFSDITDVYFIKMLTVFKQLSKIERFSLVGYSEKGFVLSVESLMFRFDDTESFQNVYQVAALPQMNVFLDKEFNTQINDLTDFTDNYVEILKMKRI